MHELSQRRVIFAPFLFLMGCCFNHSSCVFICHVPYFLSRWLSYIRTNKTHQLALRKWRCSFQCGTFPFSLGGSPLSAGVWVCKGLSRLTGWRRRGCRDGHFHYQLFSKLIMERLTHASSPLESQTQLQWSLEDSHKWSKWVIGCNKGSA